jgi:hypothetical protein
MKRIAEELVRLSRDLVGASSWEYSTRWNDDSQIMVVTLEYDFPEVNDLEPQEKFLERFKAVVSKMQAHAAKMSSKKRPDVVEKVTSRGQVDVGHGRVHLGVTVEFDNDVEVTESEAESIVEKLVN